MHPLLTTCFPLILHFLKSKPPKIRFLHRKIWHPKINHLGDVYLPELYIPGQWKPVLTITTLVMSIQQMLDHPGDMMHNGSSILNADAAKQFMENGRLYRDQALAWAKEDNCGFGMVEFEDYREYRLKAIQSVLAIPNVIKYECHLFCHKEHQSLIFKVVAAVVPKLPIYREKVEKDYFPMYQRLTIQEFQFQEAQATIESSKHSRDKCWEICIEDCAFKKSEIDHIDPRKESPPHCLIKLTWLRPERNLHPFTEKFWIKDSKNDVRAFDVHVDTSCTVTKNSSQDLTLPLLQNLPISSGKNIDITEEVGVHYFKFGVQLLNNETGAVLEAIEKEMQNVPSNITRRILTQWLQGKGKNVTWEVLVDALESIHLSNIANHIRGTYVKM